jgi:hypothetical protein
MNISKDEINNQITNFTRSTQNDVKQLSSELIRNDFGASNSEYQLGSYERKLNEIEQKFSNLRQENDNFIIQFEELKKEFASNYGSENISNQQDEDQLLQLEHIIDHLASTLNNLPIERTPSVNNEDNFQFKSGVNVIEPNQHISGLLYSLASHPTEPLRRFDERNIVGREHEQPKLPNFPSTVSFIYFVINIG